MNVRNDQGCPQGKQQRGAVVVFVAVGLTALIGIGALAIDVGYSVTTRSELQNVADGAALAGARYLGEEYSKLPLYEMGSYTFTQGEVYNAVNAVAIQNKAANKGISIKREDVRIGRWDAEQSIENIYTETLVGPDAVTVIARRDDTSANGPISTFLARIVNINTINVASKRAIAALSGPDQVEEGELQTPFGLSQNVFPNNCTDVISFSPTASCAGWHNFFDPINANALGDKLLGLIQGYSDCEHCGDFLNNGPQWLSDNFDIKKTPDAEETPVTSTGDDLEFQGGTVGAMFLGGYLDADYDGNTGTVLDNDKKPAPILALFDFFRYRDGDGDDSIWTATIPVYEDSDSCANPNGAIAVKGFANIEILEVSPPPDSNLNVRVDCELAVVDGRGSGTTFGNLRGTIPNLVK